MSNLIGGLSPLGNPYAIMFLVLGAWGGVLIGVLPGLGGAVVLSIALSFLYQVNLTGALCLFLGVHAASYFSASLTSILLNAPAHPEAIPVSFDGYPMASKGSAGRAVGLSAAATGVGGVLGCAIVLALIHVVAPIGSLFHAPAYVVLTFIVLVLVGTLGSQSMSKAIIAGGLGLLISSIGPDPATGANRFTFGSAGLFQGVTVISVVLGVFVVPQVIIMFGTGSTTPSENFLGRRVNVSDRAPIQRGPIGEVFSGIGEAFRHKLLMLQSAVIGVASGIVPGIGGFAGNFLSYEAARITSRKSDVFGTGVAEGVIGAEGSSMAKEAGGLVPLIALGLPGGVGGVLLLAALNIEGISLGYGFTDRYPTLAYEMVWIIALAGLLGTLMGVVGAPILARVTKAPASTIVPFILVLAVIGPIMATGTFFAVKEELIFVVVGLALRRSGYPLVALIVGLILGPTMETNLEQSVALYPGWDFFSRSPFADILIGVGLLLVAARWRYFRRLRQKNRAAGGAENDFPLLSVIVSASIVVVATFFAVYGATTYDLHSALMPIIGGGSAALGALWRLAVDLRCYSTYRRARPEPHPVVDGPNDSPDGITIIPQRDVRQLTTANVAHQATRPEPVSVAPGPVRSVAETVEPEPVEQLPDMSTKRQFVRQVVERSWLRNGQYSREVIAVAWMLFIVAGGYLIGLQRIVPLFCLLYGLFATRLCFSGWRTRAVFGIAAAATMWALTAALATHVYIQETPILFGPPGWF